MLVVAGAHPWADDDGPNAAGVVEVRTLSNRADLISGGSALVEAVLPDGTPASSVRVTVDDRDVTSAFGMRSVGRYPGRYVGLVDGLKDGPNAVRVTLAD